MRTFHVPRISTKSVDDHWAYLNIGSFQTYVDIGSFFYRIDTIVSYLLEHTLSLLALAFFWGTNVLGVSSFVEASAGSISVHLFEWKWPDEAKKCGNFLGPNGGLASKYLLHRSTLLIAIVDGKWREKYKSCSVKFESRSGTRAEFQDMVLRWQEVGVPIYDDAIIDHMSSAGSGKSSAEGSSLTPYNYPGL